MNRDEVRARIVASSSEEHFERLEHLDRGVVEPPRTPRARAPADGARPDVDVVLAGGGLSLLYAPLLARRGARVVVVERARAAAAHREWNASRSELTRLSDVGLLTQAEIDSDLIVARYDRGFCRWHRGGSYDVRGVLDCAVDASRLLRRARAEAERAGVEIVDGATVVAHAEGPSAVAVEAIDRLGTSTVLTTRLLLDARGASSPLATPDLVCPTVGGVLRGLEEGDGPDQLRPNVGEILVTTEGVVDGRQHLWEAFPGRAGETTVYLFHYALASARAPGMLLGLYGRFFEALPTYKRGDAELVRPTFGVIPGWSRLTPTRRPRASRILLVGDAAALHSPLTFCGFGAMLRSLAPVTAAVMARLDGDAADWSAVLRDADIHLGTGALARMMARPSPRPRDANALNELLDAAFASLAEMGDAPFGALLRDEMELADFVTFLRRTAAKRPHVYLDVVRRLGLGGVAAWGSRLVPALAGR